MTARVHIEAMAAATAIVVSVASLYIAIRQTSVMERQLEASVWPSLGYDTDNSVDGKPTVRMSVKNGGIGPARVRSVEVSCFCSALEQCWTVGFKEREPSPIPDCIEASKRPQYKQ